MRPPKPREKPREALDKYLINEQIKALEVRVIAVDGSQLGVLDTRDAMKIAEEQGVDLVEVAPEATPPVCRLLDYGKLKYKEQKKAAETRKRSSAHVVKELRIRYNTDKHDLETKIRNARRFLEAGDRVKFQMRFRGRESSYKDLGDQTFKQIADVLQDIAAVEDVSPLVGQRMNLTLAPKGAGKV